MPPLAIFALRLKLVELPDIKSSWSHSESFAAALRTFVAHEVAFNCTSR